MNERSRRWTCARVCVKPRERFKAEGWLNSLKDKTRTNRQDSKQVNENPKTYVSDTPFSAAKAPYAPNQQLYPVRRRLQRL